MANCHALFIDFNNIIRLTEEKRQALLSARNDLRTRINAHFNSVNQQWPAVHQIEFQTQGSFVMDTIINPISEDYDLDEGVYFLGPYSRPQRPPVKNFHDFILDSVKKDNYFIKDVIDKDTCVRVFYKEGYSYLFENKKDKLAKGFHVDLPIYYATNKRSPDLAHLKKLWTTSDPIEFIEWFEKKVKSNFRSEFLYEKKLFSEAYSNWKNQIRRDDAQLRRIVRYLKAWCDYQGREMPCGIIITILGANNYISDNRDDVSLKKTLTKIKSELDQEFACLRPTTPKDEDLFEDYEYRELFQDKLNAFENAASQALNESNSKRACAKWQTQFGKRFSCLTALNEDENALEYGSPVIINRNAKSA